MIIIIFSVVVNIALLFVALFLVMLQIISVNGAVYDWKRKDYFRYFNYLVRLSMPTRKNKEERIEAMLEQVEKYKKETDDAQEEEIYRLMIEELSGKDKDYYSKTWDFTEAFKYYLFSLNCYRAELSKENLNKAKDSVVISLRFTELMKIVETKLAKETVG